MNRSTILASTLLALAAPLVFAAAEVSPPKASTTEPAAGRISFRITAFEETAGGRKVISDASVEGPPGTDFNVNLQDGRFKMSARFLTDLAPGGGLALRARLDTRRLYGRSEAGLPLYEEDAQRHALRVGFDEAVVLLPFGGGGDGGRLSIEITPARVAGIERVPAPGMTAPVIAISKPSPGGAISIEATKVPHHFAAEAVLLEDGREVARGAATCLLEEPSELPLRSTAPSGTGTASPLAINLTVERFESGPGPGRAAVRFDLSREDTQQTGSREALARNWSGVAGLGSEMTYDLSQTYRGILGKKYELKLRVNLAKAEAVER
jgi:hypothetical protein